MAKEGKGCIFPYQARNNRGTNAIQPKLKQMFLALYFAFDTSLPTVLTQKAELNNERPISFMSASLQGLELNYPTIDRQAYAMYKAVKHFRPYLLKNHCIIFVLHPTVRPLLVQQELGERRKNGMRGLQGYDLDINLVHTIKGHGLCKLAV